VSGNLYYEKTIGKKKNIYCSTPSTLRQIIEGIFGELPLRLGANNLDILIALSIYHKYMECNISNKENPFRDIVDAIEKYDEIEIDMEY